MKACRRHAQELFIECSVFVTSLVLPTRPQKENIFLLNRYILHNSFLLASFIDDSKQRHGTMFVCAHTACALFSEHAWNAQR